MGKTDSAAKECFSDNTRFADFCNAVLFDGEQIVKPDSLEEKDSTEVLSIFGTNPEQIHIQKWRDILKNIIIKTDNKVCFALIGIESQANIHYAMPVRNMIYDALNYGYQVKEAAKKHRIKKDTMSNEEFLSGFSNEDTLTPVITITVYIGDKDWNAPRCLSDMFSSVDEHLKPYLQDFNANLFVPSEFDDFNKFQTELKQIFKVLSASGNKEKMSQILLEDQKFKLMDNETVRIINDITGTKFPLNRKGKVVNMCKAWNDQYEDGRLNEIFSSVQEGDYSLIRGAEKAGMSIDMFEKAMQEAGYKLPINI